jgi:hypothetical protein
VGNSNDNDRYVVPRPDGWAVEKKNHQRASAKTRTQQQAIDRAEQITHNLGGGDVRIQDRKGRFRDGRRVK